MHEGFVDREASHCQLKIAAQTASKNHGYITQDQLTFAEHCMRGREKETLFNTASRGKLSIATEHIGYILLSKVVVIVVAFHRSVRCIIFDLIHSQWDTKKANTCSVPVVASLYRCATLFSPTTCTCSSFNVKRRHQAIYVL